MGHSRRNRGQARREQLREEGDERQELRASRSNAQQIELLDQRLGVGEGAKRERARLAREIDEAMARKRKMKDKSSKRKSNQVRRETKG